MQQKKPIQKENHVILYLLVKPKSFKKEVIGFQEGVLVIRVTSAPEKGKANKEVIEVLCEYFNKPQSEVEILSGSTSSHKKVMIYNCTLSDIYTS